jgi:hypothetical protein
LSKSLSAAVQKHGSLRERPAEQDNAASSQGPSLESVKDEIFHKRVTTTVLAFLLEEVHLTFSMLRPGLKHN